VVVVVVVVVVVLMVMVVVLFNFAQQKKYLSLSLLLSGVFILFVCLHSKHIISFIHHTI
jgi:hypothetical protein